MPQPFPHLPPRPCRQNCLTARCVLLNITTGHTKHAACCSCAHCCLITWERNPTGWIHTIRLGEPNCRRLCFTCAILEGAQHPHRRRKGVGPTFATTPLLLALPACMLRAAQHNHGTHICEYMRYAGCVHNQHTINTISTPAQLKAGGLWDDEEDLMRLHTSYHGPHRTHQAAKLQPRPPLPPRPCRQHCLRTASRSEPCCGVGGVMHSSSNTCSIHSLIFNECV
jgi:hypothetical protein